MPIEFESNKDGVSASVIGDFTRNDAEVLNDTRPYRLTMRTPEWSGFGLEHLPYAKSVTRLRLFCHNHIDISGLSGSGQLERILVYGNPSGKLRLNELANISALSLNLQGASKLKLHGLSLLKNLHTLDGNISSVYFDELGRLSELVLLSLKKSRVDNLEFLRSMKGLVGLSLSGFSGLVDISCLSSVAGLKFLKILGSRKISNYREFALLKDMEVLMFDDCAPINSLEFTDLMSDLHGLSFSGDTCVRDGKISILKSRPMIRYVNFVDRNHYDCLKSDLPFDFEWMSLSCAKYQSPVT